MIALPTQPEREVLGCIVLALVAVFVLTCLLRIAEAVGERIERHTDRPLLFVRSPGSIEGLADGIRARARRLKEALARFLRPAAAELEHNVEAQRDERAATGLRTDHSETRVREREGSPVAEDVALLELDAAFIAPDRLEVRGADGAARPAAEGDQGSGLVGHDTKVRMHVKGREW
jgi:hypothetical protein